mmetsp:Transcript_3109/g.4148  ORF Transcript_3109/g.4148 Transcript_3109/m.4148 type:complete len:432 (-) Transcript_3109:1040-2335(-)
MNEGDNIIMLPPLFRLRYDFKHKSSSIQTTLLHIALLLINVLFTLHHSEAFSTFQSLKSQHHNNGEYTRARIILHQSSNNKTSKPESQPIDEEKNELFQKRSKSWIVLVDDEESIRLTLGNYLYNSGYSVTACSDAEALLELLSSSTVTPQGKEDGSVIANAGNDGTDKFSSFNNRFPSVIICDIRMPGQGIDGLDLLAILKSPAPSSDDNSNDSDYIRQQWKRIPVVLLTAKSLTPDRIEGYRRGADVYLPKPFSPDELLSIVDNLIQRTQILSDDTSVVQGKKRGPSLSDLKGEMLDIKSIIKEQNAHALSRGSKNSIENGGDSNQMTLSPSTLITSKKTQTGGKILARNDVSQSDLDAFNEQVKLSPSEKEVLGLLSEGYTNAEIAKLRGNSSVTSVSRTLSNLYIKTMTKTRTELVKWGMQMGYIDA